MAANDRSFQVADKPLYGSGINENTPFLNILLLNRQQHPTRSLTHTRTKQTSCGARIQRQWVTLTFDLAFRSAIR